MYGMKGDIEALWSIHSIQNQHSSGRWSMNRSVWICRLGDALLISSAVPQEFAEAQVLLYARLRCDVFANEGRA